jgi:hypothetical protein
VDQSEFIILKIATKFEILSIIKKDLIIFPISLRMMAIIITGDISDSTNVDRF